MNLKKFNQNTIELLYIKYIYVNKGHKINQRAILDRWALVIQERDA